ncbi:MAG: DUF2087 domain-containing protein [Bacillota bacterium]
MKTIENYLDCEKRVKAWPSKKEGKLIVLKYLASKFEYGTFYTEKQVNRIISDMHTFNDYFILRRELVESKLLGRTRDCSKYWREKQSTEYESNNS